MTVIIPQVISKRFQSRFHMLTMIFPSEDQIRRIFGTMLTHKMLDFPDEARTKCDNITSASIDLFKVLEKLFHEDAQAFIRKIIMISNSSVSRNFGNGHVAYPPFSGCFGLFSTYARKNPLSIQFKRHFKNVPRFVPLFCYSVFQSRATQ